MPIIIISFYNYLQRQKIDLQKKTSPSSSFSFHNYLQNFECNNFNQFLNNLSYLTPISHKIFVNLFLSLLLSLTAQCGFKAHKTNAVTSSPPSSTTRQSLALGKIFEFTQKDFSRADNTHNHQLFSVFFNIFHMLNFLGM
jgi:hypothetical protein